MATESERYEISSVRDFKEMREKISGPLSADE